MANCDHCGDEFYSEGPGDILCGRCFEVAELKAEIERLKDKFNREKEAHIILMKFVDSIENELGLGEPKIFHHCAHCCCSEDAGQHLPGNHAYQDPRILPVIYRLRAENERLKTENVRLWAMHDDTLAERNEISADWRDMADKTERFKELVYDLRGYTRDWDWKYGAEWDKVMEELGIGSSTETVDEEGK